MTGTCSLVGNGGTLPNNTPSNPDNCLFSGSKNYKKLTYTFSADWHPTPDILLYAVTRTGYRSGGFNQSATVNTTAQPTVLTPFKPETVTDYEIGFKGNWRFDNGMRAGINLAAYRAKYDNIQRALTSRGGNKLVVANAASATIKGAEVELRFEPTEWLELSGYYSYVDPKYNSFVVTDAALYSAVGDFTPSKFGGVANHSGGATISAHTELSDDRGRIAAAVDYYGQTGFYVADNNYDAVTKTFSSAGYAPGYWLLGANLGWTNVMGKPIDAAINVRNITDKRYYTGGVDSTVSAIGTAVFYVSQPRMYTFSLTFHY